MCKIYLPLLILLIAPLLMPSGVYGQELCGTSHIHEHLLKTDPAYRTEFEKSNERWNDYLEQKKKLGNRPIINGMDTIYEIPVVIHVLHTGDAVGTPYNPTDAQLEEWIDFLSEVYAADYPGYPGVNDGGVPMPVKFVLATTDPDCNPTNGIDRVDMSANNTYLNNGLNSGNFSQGLTTSQITSIVQWPTDQYYNIYVVNKINGQDGFNVAPGVSFTVGFAYLGTSSNLSLNDGAYMLSYSAHSGSTTLPHEIGHALGLFHVFDDNNPTACPFETNCQTQGDLVCDTDPTTYFLTTPCPGATDINPCTGTAYGVHGVQHNIMNYGNCRDVFTSGQAERMMFMLKNNRTSLIHSNKAAPLNNNQPSTPSLVAACVPGQISDLNNNYSMGPCGIFLDSIQYYSNPYNANLQDYYVDNTQGCAFPVHTTLSIGQSYDFKVTVNGLNPQFVKAYIDFNNDGVFDPVSELVLSGANNPSSGSGQFDTIQGNFMVPNAAVLNTPIRMRVISDFYSYSNGTSSCSSLQFGQTEDFSITIQDEDILPIKLVNLQGAIVEDKKALITWEVDGLFKENDHFELQRSLNGKNFEPIFTNFFDEGVFSYRFLDESPNVNVSNFYRLKIKEADGNDFYSRIVRLDFNTQNQGITLFPNPAKDFLFFETTAAIQLMQIYNIEGKVILQKYVNERLNTSVHKINISAYTPGIYILHLVDIHGISHRLKFQKQ